MYITETINLESILQNVKTEAEIWMNMAIIKMLHTKKYENSKLEKENVIVFSVLYAMILGRFSNHLEVSIKMSLKTTRWSI